MTAKKTPLFAAYRAIDAQLRDAGGYFTLAAFSEVADEHKAIRESGGLFPSGSRSTAPICALAVAWVATARPKAFYDPTSTRSRA